MDKENKMEIPELIRTLLFEKDCVILPGFGGFIIKPHHASIDYSTETIYPPRREVAFNEALKDDDGLLTRHLAGIRKLSFETAREQVAEYVQDVKSKISTQKVHLEGIGSLKMAGERIEFIPDNSANFLYDAYGLEAFHFPMLHSPAKQSSQKIIEKSPVQKEKKRKSYAIPAALSTAALIALLVMSYIHKKQFYSGLQINNAGFDTMHIQKNPGTSTQDAKLDVLSQIPKQENSIIPDAKRETTASGPGSVSPEKNTPSYQPKSQGEIDIIAGSFSSKVNARKRKKALEVLGYTPHIISTGTGMYRVSVMSFSDIEEARAKLPEIRHITGMNTLWILH